jgi:hypothetical protein
MLSIEQVIALAKEHAPKAEMRSSAELCIADAEFCLARVAANPEWDWTASARKWALKSLAYSVGKLSPIYKQAAE